MHFYSFKASLLVGRLLWVLSAVIVQSIFRVLCFQRQLRVVFCLLVGAVLALLLHIAVVEAYRLTWCLRGIRFALFVVKVKESVLFL
jgi:hypothetical protein